jgi:hypothetical protein
MRVPCAAVAAREISHYGGGWAEVKSGQPKGSDERSAMSMKIKTIVIVVIVIVLAAVVLPLAGIFVFPHLPGHHLLLQYLLTIAPWSWWPLAALILFIFFCLLFRSQISKLLDALKDIDLLKGKATFVQQSPAPSPDVKDQEATKSRVQEYERLLFLGRIIRIMYRSQYDLLLEIRKLNSMPIQNLIAWYEGRFQGDKAIMPYVSYTNYLFGNGLIEASESEIHLTPFGIEFLKFSLDYPVEFLYPL